MKETIYNNYNDDQNHIKVKEELEAATKQETQKVEWVSPVSVNWNILEWQMLKRRRMLTLNI